VTTIADRLKAELDAAHADIAGASDRAAAAAHRYIVRRLQQLERHYARHRFVFEHRSGSELRCFPAIQRYHDVPIILRLAMRRATAWPCLRALFSVRQDLHRVASEIGRLQRLLGRIDSGSVCPGRWWVCDERRRHETDYERTLVKAALAAGDDDAAERARRFDMGGLVIQPRSDRAARAVQDKPPPPPGPDGRGQRKRRDDGTSGCGYF